MPSISPARRMRALSASCYFLVALVAGVFVYLPLRDQEVHATPQAILLACALASAVAALLGWGLGATYRGSQLRAQALVAVPLLVLFCATAVAALTYLATAHLFHPFPLRIAHQHAPEQLVFNAAAYAIRSSPAWAGGLPICSLFLRKRAVAYGI
jgi:hypothetical protein